MFKHCTGGLVDMGPRVVRGRALVLVLGAGCVCRKGEM